LPVKVIGVVALWLLAASTASAAPSDYTRDSRLCDGQQTRKLHLPKSYGGPLASRARSNHSGPRFDLSAHVRRAKRTSLGNGAAAIANDAPAARDDGDGNSLASLRPIGFLIGPVDSHARTRSFSPRPPRGPPASV
jgi:hypothetical protein